MGGGAVRWEAQWCGRRGSEVGGGRGSGVRGGGGSGL